MRGVTALPGLFPGCVTPLRHKAHRVLTAHCCAQHGGSSGSVPFAVARSGGGKRVHEQYKGMMHQHPFSA